MRKIAIPITKENTIDEHFGHCEFYGIFTISDEQKIVDFQSLKSEQGCGCKSNIASVLAQQGVNTMLAGGIGSGAINVLNASGIEVVKGCSGDAALLVEAYLEGKVTDSGESCAEHENHHAEGHEHQCEH